MQVIHGDSLEVMKTFPDNHFTNIITDPPYGLSFMGKNWDKRIPGQEFWQEMLRICKPGTMLLAFGGTRTYHRLTCAIEDAGWEIRDCMIWLYGSGFPKSHNHFGFEGYGTALKPSYEPIIMAMKPLDGTFKENAEKWGVAGINIDDSRIGSDGATKRSHQEEYPTNEDGNKDRSQHWARTGHHVVGLNKGRWPANTILDEQAAVQLDLFSGLLKSGSGDKHNKNQTGKTFTGIKPISGIRNYESDSGGASRFFYCAKASPSERDMWCDADLFNREEIEERIGGGMNSTIAGDTRSGHISKHRNIHPTVKPLKLMEYLVKLLMPPKDGLILDPFLGSGSTLVAAKNLGYEGIGIELNEEYVEIAKKRIGVDKEKIFA
jgi:DNA modification methylase